MNNFWRKYIEANELERHKLLDSLPISRDSDSFYKYFTTTLLQSYLDDLLETCQGSREE